MTVIAFVMFVATVIVLVMAHWRIDLIQEDLDKIKKRQEEVSNGG